MSPSYGLSPERHTEVDAELRRIQQFLQGLAQELENAAPSTDKRGFTWTAALEADSATAHLRHMLVNAQEKWHTWEEIQQRLGD